tara:strand:- start:1946 stop:2317 length:372 start_codon:yes stop_codon:yes gene_type:complete
MDAITTVQELDRKRIRAMIARDADSLYALLADDLFYIHASSAKDNKHSLIHALLSGALIYKVIDLSEVESRDLGDQVILIGKARVTVLASGQRSDSFERFSSCWVRRDDRWQMLGWQSTLLAD